MHYLVAAEHLGTNPVRTAHAVVPGDLSGATICGLGYPGPLLLFKDLRWDALPSGLTRCSVCATKAP